MSLVMEMCMVNVTVTTIETSKTCRESKGGVIYGDKDPNLKMVKQQGKFDDACKLKTMITKYN